jgi:hypothetical protein
MPDHKIDFLLMDELGLGVNFGTVMLIFQRAQNPIYTTFSTFAQRLAIQD